MFAKIAKVVLMAAVVTASFMGIRHFMAQDSIQARLLAQIGSSLTAQLMEDDPVLSGDEIARLIEAREQLCGDGTLNDAADMNSATVSGFEAWQYQFLQEKGYFGSSPEEANEIIQTWKPTIDRQWKYMSKFYEYCSENNLFEECDDGNKEDGDGCSSTCKIQNFCGDGNPADDEECDSGDMNSDNDPDACRTDCRTHFCGDYVTDSDEQCDEGPDGGEACTAECVEKNDPYCGDTIVDDGEECDDGERNSDNDPDTCRMSCLNPYCGDSVPDSSEQCDDGNTENGDGCDASCQSEEEEEDEPYCGDGTVDEGEDCDDGDSWWGNGSWLSSCSASCTSEPFCGNGTQDEGEACDDGNTENGDGCDNVCMPETCGDGETHRGLGEECDDGENNSNERADACRTSCIAASCGDGVTDTGEECDDGNTENGDGCDAGCQSEEEEEDEPSCGDGTQDDGEECDDGNDMDGDGCDASCNEEEESFCGDGTQDDDEECDDGNDMDGDGCSASCKEVPCGNGTLDEGEACDGQIYREYRLPDGMTCDVQRCDECKVKMLCTLG